MSIVLCEPMTRIELVTPSLPRKYSTPELHRQNQSGRRDSNPRPSAWKANALSTELLPHILPKLYSREMSRAWWGEQDSNLRRHTPADLQSAPVGRFGISPNGILPLRQEHHQFQRANHFPCFYASKMVCKFNLFFFLKIKSPDFF